MKAWQRKEKSDEKVFKGRRTKGSGKTWYSKGDIKTFTFLIECKSTVKGSFTISRKTWGKISREALLSSRIPVLSIRFEKENEEIVILSKNDFLTLFNAIDQI